MGNRAVIAFGKKPSDIGIYLHWNGGLESILAFLQVCKDRRYRDVAVDPTYAAARLTGVCCEFLKTGLSVGIGPLRVLDVNNFDNGAYLVGPDWELVSRWGKGSDPSALALSDLDDKDRAKFASIVASLAVPEAA